MTAPCAPCVAALGEELAEVFCPPHTESQVRLAHKLAAIFQPEDTDETAGWFMEDAEAVEESEGDGWVVEQHPDWNNCPVVAIQGTLYSLDINAEGHATLEPFAELEARGA